MKKFDKDNLIWFILWLFLFIIFVFFLGFGFGRHFPSKFVSEYVPIPHENRTNLLNCKSSEESHEDITEDPPIQVLIAEPMYGQELYRFYISQIHEQYYPNVDPYIALSVLEIESNYKPNLKSSAGAVGLMQWIPKWHSWRMGKFHLNDMWDPYTNIIVGMDYLNDLFQSNGSWREALYGYNHSTVYVNSVISRAEILREGGYFG